jgi:N-acetyl-anhydromuramyl-L-alanine amidase AmpD
MGYLTNLADVIRRAGLNVREEPGWQTRARRSGPYANGRPTHVMVHHTASYQSSDGQRDVNYMCYTSSYRPIANLYLDRSGTVWVLAAGATNTNGVGTDTWGGGVPNDSMNLYAISIEGANNGRGEPWPKVQTDAYVQLVAALCNQYNIPVSHVRAHAEWSPGRKIDPAGPSPWASGANTWNMDAFRASVALAGAPAPPEPVPPQKEGKMLYIAVPKYPGHTANSEWWCVFESGAVRRAVNSDVTYATKAQLPLIDQDSKEHDDFLRSIAIGS